MESFIDLCVSDILKKHGENLVKTTVVFPSKRAMVFFRKSLGEHISQPVFMPKMTTIQDFCISKQEFTIPDDFTLIYNLYQCYKKETETQESFEDFYPWGEMLLSDFDDIDKYKINAGELFTNIADIKEIDSLFDYLEPEQREMISRFWNTAKLSSTNENNIIKKFISLWNKLPKIYEDFRQKLQEQKLCFEGMAIRFVAEADIDTQDAIFGDNTYIFLGFNALSTCESTVFKFLHNRKQAFFYWDYDTFYQNDDLHEAGIFTRKNIQQFPNELGKEHFTNFESDKTIQIIKTPNEIAQAKLCGKFIQDETSLENTAIVLADEKLIVPIMKSIPNNIRYNITLGYPIRSSAAYTLFESILDMCANKEGDKIYYKDVFRICENSLIPQEAAKNANQLRKKIIENKLFSISAEECRHYCGMPYIFDINPKNGSNVSATYVSELKTCIEEICKNEKLGEIDKSIFYTIYTELSAIRDILEKREIQLEKVQFVNSLLKKTLQGKTIAVEGQPLEGLQVMGILETRMLDFKNIIMTSVMDGNLPKNKVGGSFIPYNIRVRFGMPTIKEQSAMYSYYFYRLIQRCEKLTILYSEGTGENKAEKSRFILQLLYESPFKNISSSEDNPNKTYNGISVEEYGYTINPRNEQPIEIEKNQPEVLEYINKLHTGENKLYPTSLSKFIQCELQFYFAHILGLRKPDEFDELPKAYDLGNYFHNAMEELYKPYVGKMLDEQTIDALLADEEHIKKCIDKAMENNKAPQAIANRESKEFLSTFKYIQNFLLFDKKHICKIIALEYDKTETTINGVTLSGKIDRLDFYQNVYRIGDYKTGRWTDSTYKKKFIVKNIENLFDGKEHQSEAFQTLLYAYILKSQNPDCNYQPNLYFVQNINNESPITTLTIEKNELQKFDGELYSQFKEQLEQLISRLLQTTGKFAQTSNENNCNYCNFIDFCRRKPKTY